MDTTKKSILVPPIVLFFAVLFIVVLYFFNVSASVEKEKEANLASYITETQSQITSRIDIYQETLRSGVGFFAGSSEVTREGWQRFINSTSVMPRYPGAQGIGYAAVVSSDEKTVFESAVSASQSKEYRIKPVGERDLYAPVLFLEPENERNLLAQGYDMLSDPARRKAMEAARDSGEVFVTDAVNTLRLQEEDTHSNAYAFVMYAPQYGTQINLKTVEERRQALKGYVYAAFRAEHFLSGLLEKRDADNFAFEVTNSPDGEDAKVLYTSPSIGTLRSHDHSTRQDTLKLSGTQWNISYYYISDALVPRSVSYQPKLVLLVGTFTAVLVAGMAYLLLLGKANELLIDKERDIISAKDSLLSIASHQLRTPATGVKQYLGMVLQGFVGDITPQQHTMLAKAYESNERQLKTINDVLYLARLDSGRIVLSKSVVDIKKLITSICDELESEISINKHTLKKHLPKADVTIKADEHMLRMAIENLLTNAIKYMQQGGRIDVTVKADRSRVYIAVSDEGVGIQEKDLKLLFREFSRIPNEMSKSVSGTGIGLYLTRHLIELHHGKVNVESTLGTGSTFTIILPKGKIVK